MRAKSCSRSSKTFRFCHGSGTGCVTKIQNHPKGITKESSKGDVSESLMKYCENMRKPCNSLVSVITLFVSPLLPHNQYWAPSVRAKLPPVRAWRSGTAENSVACFCDSTCFSLESRPPPFQLRTFKMQHFHGVGWVGGVGVMVFIELAHMLDAMHSWCGLGVW